MVFYHFDQNRVRTDTKMTHNQNLTKNFQSCNRNNRLVSFAVKAA